MAHRMNKEQTILDWSSYLAESKSQFQKNWCKEPNEVHSKEDFEFLRRIAKGGFSQIVLAKKDSTLYAIKIMEKDKAVDSPSFKHAMEEKRALLAARCPFIIHMDFYFSDSEHLYFVTPYMYGGDLWYRIKKSLLFPEHISRFYAAQVVLALEYLHYMNVVYRDLKPENILIHRDGYIKLADLGFCKRIKERTYTMCGTTQYMAPEILLNRGYAFPADWWSFGVLLFEMTAGRTPFFCKDELEMCLKIAKCEYTAERHFTAELQDLIDKLLQVEPSRRLGNLKNGVTDVKQHMWFQHDKWLDVLNKRIIPPFLPEIIDPAIECPPFFESDDI